MKKTLALTLALIMVLCMLPSVAFAEGTATGKAIQIGASGISGYDSTNGYDYIYYGTWSSSPIKWRVLDTKTNMGNADGLFLLSDVLLEKVPFQEHTHEAYGSHHKGPYPNSDNHTNCLKANAWQGSDAQKWCGQFYTDNLTSQEQGAVLPTTKSDKYLKVSKNQYDNFDASENILNKDKVFFLSAEEANNSTYGFTDDNARVAKDNNDTTYSWWLRSPSYGFTYNAGYVNSRFGNVNNNNVPQKYAARPAFNLDPNSVLFTSAAENGKPGDGLKEVSEYRGNEWKLTLKDNRAGFNVLSAYMVGDSLKISYSDAKTGANEYISVVVMDNNGSITHYGRSASSLTDENGVATIEGMIAMQEGRTLYAFNEQYNGDNKTDYASDLKPVKIDDAPTVNEFTKERLKATPTQGGFDAPNNMEFNFENKVIFTDNAPKANLLYSFTVTGTPGAKVTITDTGAKFYNGTDWNTADKITVTLPAESITDYATYTVYGYRPFTKDNIINGALMNTATAGVEGSEGLAPGEATVPAEDKTGPGPSENPNPSPSTEPSPTPTPTPTPGGGNGGGYYSPTTTPVPVIVIPPKTGDMTIWQSILHFLGIR